MKLSLHTLWPRAKALSAALWLLMGFLAVPMALAAHDESDACAMICCIEDGYCCCKPAKASVRKPTFPGQTTVGTVELFTSCPEGCLNSHLIGKQISRQMLIGQPSSLLRLTPVVTASQPPPTPRTVFYLTSLSPRAPPV